MTGVRPWGPGTGLLAAAGVLAVVGWVVADERIRIVLWLLAIPMALAALIPLAWSNASREIARLREGDDR